LALLFGHTDYFTDLAQTIIFPTIFDA